MTAADTPRIVVAGGGVAGLEACLGLRSFLGEDDLSIELLCRDDHFEYRPLAVLEPFDGAPRGALSSSASPPTRTCDSFATPWWRSNPTATRP